MTPQRRQQYLLLALFVVVAAAGVVQWRGRSAQGSAPGAPAAAGRPASAPPAGKSSGPVTDLHLERLQAARQEAEEPSRNPFRFRPREAPPRAETPESAAPPPAPVVPSGPPPPPPIPLKFIGLLDAPERIGRVAILSDSRGTVFYGKEGDIIDGRYQVLRIGAESAEISYADGRGRQTLRLSGQ